MQCVSLCETMCFSYWNRVFLFVKQTVSPYETHSISKRKIFDNKFGDCFPYFGFQQSAFGKFQTALAECQQPIAKSQSKSLFFVHKVTAFDDAVVGSSKHLKAAVGVDSAQVFRCYKTARVYVCKVDYVDNAALALFAFHILTVSSNEPLIIFVPSGLNATELTQCECPSKVLRRLNLVTSIFFSIDFLYYLISSNIA